MKRRRILGEYYVIQLILDPSREIRFAIKYVDCKIWHSSRPRLQTRTTEFEDENVYLLTAEIWHSSRPRLQTRTTEFEGENVYLLTAADLFLIYHLIIYICIHI